MAEQSMRERLVEALNRPTHAPMETHSQLDGSCTECPWPTYALPPEDIADAILPLIEEAKAEAWREGLRAEERDRADMYRQGYKAGVAAEQERILNLLADQGIAINNAGLGAEPTAWAIVQGKVQELRDAAAAIRGAREPEPATEAPRLVREPECVKNWPGCENGEYNPACCRWPKSCSVQLVPAPATEVGPVEKCRECGREEWGHSWLDHVK